MKNPALYAPVTRPKSSPVILQLTGPASKMPMRLRPRNSESTEPRPMKPMYTNIRQGEGEDHTSEEEMAINSQQQQKPRILDENILLNHPRLKDRAKSARRESGSLREYSRKRFQTVVALESQSVASSSHSGASQTPLSFSRPKTTGGRVEKREMTKIPLTPTNGPTKDGSILYNSKPSLLSSIRARPTSETPGRFDHLRGTSAYHPDIQHVLEKSNCQFRVGVSSPCQTARTQRSESSGLQDFVMLIPVTSAPSDVTVALGDGDNDDDDDGSVRSAEWTAGPAWVEEQILQTSTARSKLPKKSKSSKMKVAVPAKQAERDGKERPLSDRTRNTQRSLRTPSPGVPRVNLTELLPEEEDWAPKTRLNPAAAPQAPDNTLKSQKSPARLTVPGSTKRRPGSSKKRGSSRPNSARSDTSSVISSISARSPRPLCWVDDVTISSDESLPERDASLQSDLELEKVSGVSGDVPANRNPVQGLSPRREAQQRGSNSPAAAEKKKVVNLSKRINPTGAGPKRVPSAGGKANKLASGSKVGVKETRGRRGLAGAVVSEGGDEYDLPVFPRFLCPSSESKSRQAAIKEWLAKTSFSAACRTVPLM